jgi:hypothetical protein
MPDPNRVAGVLLRSPATQAAWGGTSAGAPAPASVGRALVIARALESEVNR